MKSKIKKNKILKNNLFISNLNFVIYYLFNLLNKYNYITK